MQSKQYSNQLKEFQAVNKQLGPAIKQAVTRNKYIKARDRYIDKKEKNKLDTMEAQVGYIENVVKKADEIHKQNKAATTLNNAFRNKIARKTYKNLDENAPYIPQVYDSALNAAKIKKTKVLSHARTGRIYTDHERVIRKATQSINSISALVKPKSNAGRPRISPPK
jgi:hypothetical protein